MPFRHTGNAPIINTLEAISNDQYSALYPVDCTCASQSRHGNLLRVYDRQITLMPKPSIQRDFGLAYCIHTDTIQLMPKSIDQLSAQRDALLAQLKSIDRLRRGTLSRQVFTRLNSSHRCISYAV